MKETAAETQRLATDPGLLNSISRKHAFASHNLLKADTEAAGEDFERKRAWDWTIDESEKWDRRMDKKQRHRDDVAFQDYTQDARKVYKRQLRELAPDLEAYEKEKLAAIEKAAANGDLEIVETEDGEMIAIDKNGSFYSTADSVGFTDNKPNRANVDKLVNDLRKAEEVRLKKRKERRGDEEADVTYINEKNKQFNQKLARFYNKVCITLDLNIIFHVTNPLPVHNRDSGQLRAWYNDLMRNDESNIIHVVEIWESRLAHENSFTDRDLRCYVIPTLEVSPSTIVKEMPPMNPAFYAPRASSSSRPLWPTAQSASFQRALSLTHPPMPRPLPRQPRQLSAASRPRPRGIQVCFRGKHSTQRRQSHRARLAM